MTSQETETSPEQRSLLRRAVGAAAIGNCTEWYDFGVYAYVAVYVGHQFFPGPLETVSAFGKSLDTIRMLVRIAPGLGLIGTLIPMGTGLAALGQGDITKLSSDLVIAFTTTVVGLALGICAYFFHTIKRRWIEHDIRMIEFITEALAQRPIGETDHEVHEEEESAGG